MMTAFREFNDIFADKWFLIQIARVLRSNALLQKCRWLQFPSGLQVHIFIPIVNIMPLSSFGLFENIHVKCSIKMMQSSHVNWHCQLGLQLWYSAKLYHFHCLTIGKYRKIPVSLDFHLLQKHDPLRCIVAPHGIMMNEFIFNTQC